MVPTSAARNPSLGCVADLASRARTPHPGHVAPALARSRGAALANLPHAARWPRSSCSGLRRALCPHASFAAVAVEPALSYPIRHHQPPRAQASSHKVWLMNPLCSPLESARPDKFVVRVY